MKELLGHPQLGLNPIGFVDDDRVQARPPHVRPAGARLIWRRCRTSCSHHEIDEIVIAMPRAPGAVVRQVVRAALEAGVKTRTVPGMFDIISGRVTRGLAPPGRDPGPAPARADPDRPGPGAVLATGETVLVTGAGGSIGSELCRQLARLEPAQIVLLGHGENSIFDILPELTERFPDVTTASRSSPTCATASGCGRSSSSTARTPSSTPPPTSTCR